MTGVSASAPGKIVVCGEYAVLDDAPAIVTAVARRATVDIDFIAGTECVLVAPGMINEESRFRREASGRCRWSGEPYPLVEKVFDEFAGQPVPALTLRLDTREFRDAACGRKLGLGSSAAVATALVAAIDVMLGSKSDVLSIAASAHKAFQSGKGSGVDVAASFAGGTLRFGKAAAPPMRALNWPAGLVSRILWSGHPADTAGKLQRLDARKAAGKRSAAALALAAHRAADAWEGGSARAVLAALAEFVVQLQAFDAVHELGVFDAGHQALLAPAEALGLVYKPCGAGGGDIGMVFGTGVDCLDTFCEQAGNAGFVPLDLAVAAPGVAIDANVSRRNES